MTLARALYHQAPFDQVIAALNQRREQTAGFITYDMFAQYTVFEAAGVLGAVRLAIDEIIYIVARIRGASPQDIHTAWKAESVMKTGFDNRPDLDLPDPLAPPPVGSRASVISVKVMLRGTGGDKECDAGGDALLAHALHPRRLHRPSTRPALATDHHPVDGAEIQEADVLYRPASRRIYDRVLTHEERDALPRGRLALSPMFVKRRARNARGMNATFTVTPCRTSTQIGARS